jgi:hypothetical protein
VEEDGGCILQRSGRYKHTARYIKDELRKQSGFEMIRKRQAIGRVERGVPVQVLVVIVQKISNSSEGVDGVAEVMQRGDNRRYRGMNSTTKTYQSNRHALRNVVKK